VAACKLNPQSREKIVTKMMSEAQTITNKQVIEFRVTLEKRIAGATHRRHLCHGQVAGQHHGKFERADPVAASRISRNHLG